LIKIQITKTAPENFRISLLCRTPNGILALMDPPAEPLPMGILQAFLVNIPRSGPGQLVQEGDLLGGLVTGQMVFAEANDLLFGNRGAGL
jgi:hypothetical protein